jgi:hypothetical protein
LQGAAGTVAEGSVEYASALPMDARGASLPCPTSVKVPLITLRLRFPTICYVKTPIYIADPNLLLGIFFSFKKVLPIVIA